MRLTRPGPYGIALGLILVVSLLLRLWGLRSGLPYAFNADENAHFVPKAIGLFGHSWEPPKRYFVNPPAFTYLLHIVFAVWYGGRSGVAHAYATNPTAVFALARGCAAVLGTIAVWLLYLAGARLFDRRVGLLAAALMGSSFLPVFYSKLALNDVPTLAPLGLSLWAVAGILRQGRNRDYLIAGVGLGLAAATKYTGGIVIVPLVAAAGAQFMAPGGRPAAVRGLLIAAIAAVVAFVIANPYALLDYHAFRDGLSHQTTAADDSLGKLGLSQTNGFLYYLWTVSWGMGWVALFGAVGGALALVRDERRLLWVLAPAPVLFILFMGSQTRFFGRWLLPIFPMVALLAAYFLIEVADALGRRRPALRPVLFAVAGLALCGQGLVYSLHSGLVNARADTRNIVRNWMVENVPERAKIVVEPIVPDGWAQDVGNPSGLVSKGDRWTKFPTSRATIDPDTGKPVPPPGVVVSVEDYERTLTPELIQRYEAGGYCWVVTGSTQRGRSEAQPNAVPQAVAYYAALQRDAIVAYQASPYAKGRRDVPFNFDWSFDYYPLAYHRPGPQVTVYRLKGGPLRGRILRPENRVPVLTSTDRELLSRAVELARNGMGRVHPNPIVGAVIARDGEVVGEGWHEQFGGPHAERQAIADAAGADLSGATMYVSLEPCCHHGKTPPCTDAIIEAGIGRVVVASDDPSERANGRGLGILRDEGVDVVILPSTDEIARSARFANQAFRKHAKTGRPWVLFKSAMTLDGKVATRSGDSKWISSESSRARAHRWRASVDGVVVGIGTALADDPQLTARVDAVYRQPTRIVFDSEARLPLDSQLVRAAHEIPLIVVVSRAAPRSQVEQLSSAGAEVIVVTGENEPARVRDALGRLGEMGITSLLLEGGPRLAGAFLGRRRDRRGSPVPRPAPAWRALRPRSSRGRGRRARGRCAARPDARVRAGRRGPARQRPAEGVVSGVHRAGR